MGWTIISDLPGAAEPSIGAGFHAPRTVTVEYEPERDEPRVKVVFEVTDGGEVRCSSVSVEATEHGREVRRADLDRPLAEMAEQAVTSASAWVSPPQDGVVSIHMVLDQPDFEFARKQVRSSRTAARRRVITEDLLREVAQVYRDALADGSAPTEAVRKHFRKSHRSAAGYIDRARRAGFLGPVLGRGKAGERGGLRDEH